MKQCAIWMALIFSTVAATVSSAEPDSGSTPNRPADDPSYVPMRDTQPPGKKSKKADKNAQPETAVPPVQVEEVLPPGPRVKYILDGKPIYVGEVPVDGSAVNDSSPKDSPKKSSKKAAKEDDVVSEPVVSAAPEKKSSIPIGPRDIDVLKGRTSYTGPRQTGSTPVYVQPSNTNYQQTSGPAVRPPVDNTPDLTADQPGTAAAAMVDQNNLAEFAAPTPIDSRAKKCYALLASMKTNLDTIARCLDIRGKENARLIHAGDEVSKNISDIAAIWPKNDPFYERCANVKRCALLFNDELSQSPWKWSQVRWSFDALVKEARGFREYCKVLADAERPPRPVFDKKGVMTGYEDVPDVELDPITARREAQAKADAAEIARVKRQLKEEEEAKKDQKLDQGN